MTTVMIVHSTCGSKVYIGMYIHDCMTSQCSFYYNETNCPFLCILSHFEVINNMQPLYMVIGYMHL